MHSQKAVLMCLWCIIPDIVADFKIKPFLLTCIKPNLKLENIVTVSMYIFLAQIQIIPELILEYVIWYSADKNEPGCSVFSADWTQIFKDAEAA